VVEADRGDRVLGVEADRDEALVGRRLLGQGGRVVEVGLLDVHVERSPDGILVAADELLLDGVFPDLDSRVLRPLPVLVALLAALLARGEAVRHRHAEHVGADREGGQDLVAGQGAQLGDAELGRRGGALVELHRLGEDEQAAGGVGVRRDVAPGAQDVLVLVLVEAAVLGPGHAGEPAAGRQHVADVARDEVGQGHLRVDRLDDADRVVLADVLDDEDLLGAERHAARRAVVVEDPADQLALLVAGGPHARRADAVHRRRQAAAVAALEVDEGAAGHVEPDLALLLQLSPGLPGVRALGQAQELLERIEPLEGRAVLGGDDLLGVVALAVLVREGPRQVGEVAADAALGLVEPARLVGPQVGGGLLLVAGAGDRQQGATGERGEVGAAHDGLARRSCKAETR
jgi:hypothetical protein